MVKETFNAKETFEAGYEMGKKALPGQIYCLNGDLGVGKTVFTQGFAKGLGIEEPVNSPTFTIIQEYHEGRLPLYHFDVYRIGDVEEMDELGYEEYFYSDGVCLIEYTINHKMTHSQTLLPMIDEIFSMVQLKPDDVDVIAVSKGPGSFTGLRIGAATGKGIALALDKKMVAVPTLAAMAYNLYGDSRYICPVMDARRKHLYSGIYTFDGDRLITVRDVNLESYDELAEELAGLDGQVVLVGDGVDVAGDVLKEQLGDKCVLAPAHIKTQRAGSVALLAKQMADNGEYTDADELKPDYLRPSQAEREKAQHES